MPLPLITLSLCVCLISFAWLADDLFVCLFGDSASSYHRVDVCARGPKLLGEIVEPAATLTHLERYGPPIAPSSVDRSLPRPQERLKPSASDLPIFPSNPAYTPYHVCVHIRHEQTLYNKCTTDI